MKAGINGARVLAPASIPFPDRATLDREHAARVHCERLREATRLENATRQATLISAAAQSGREAGYRAGYVEGWRWGVWCGAVAGAFAGIAATLLVQWLHALSALVP